MAVIRRIATRACQIIARFRWQCLSRGTTAARPRSTPRPCRRPPVVKNSILEHIRIPAIGVGRAVQPFPRLPPPRPEIDANHPGSRGRKFCLPGVHLAASLAQYPLANGDNHSAFFGCQNEIRRGNQASLRILEVEGRRMVPSSRASPFRAPGALSHDDPRRRSHG
jgi:hypothetical protein